MKREPPAKDRSDGDEGDHSDDASETDEAPFDPEAPIVLPLEGAIDLHPFAPRDIPSVVDEYLRAAREAGFDEVRVVHGRGKGVQRDRVQRLLAEHPEVEAFRDAPAHLGGWGATIVRLKSR